MAAPHKTNVMRLLDQAGISYKVHTYAGTGTMSGADVARTLGQNPAQVFKTLVTVAKSGRHCVFVVPVEKELHLKKAAQSAGEKAVEMLKQKDLLPTTGYVHGGCSPIGMKKPFFTVVDQSAAQFETILMSAGKIGFQVELRPQDLQKIVPFVYGSIT